MVLLAAVFAIVPDAEACSCASHPAVIAPRPNATNVPTNVAFLLDARGSNDMVELVGPFGVVDRFLLSSQAQRLRPTHPLAPNTDYELRAQNDAPVLFRTGTGPDVTPPVIADFSFTSKGYPAGPCGGGLELRFHPTGVSDDSPGPIHLALFTGETTQTIDATTPRLLFGDHPMLWEGAKCVPTNFPLSQTPQLAGALVAVDLAGNQSALTAAKQLRSSGCSAAPGGLAVIAVALHALRLSARRRRGTDSHP